MGPGPRRASTCETALWVWRFRGATSLTEARIAMGVGAVKKRLRSGGRPYFGTASTLYPTP